MKLNACILAATALLASAATVSAQTSMPPCESAPPPTSTSTKVPAPTAPTNVRIVKGSGGDLDLDEELPPSGPSVEGWEDGTEPFEAAAAAQTTSGPHAYYWTLASRADCFRAYSLRNQAQIEQYRRSGNLPSDVNYDPAGDLDPRRQDAAKVVVTGASLKTQVWLPINMDGGETLMITWDAWFGQEWNANNTGITNYKTFQICSPKENIWSEVQNNWAQGRNNGVLATVTGRYYPTGGIGPNITNTQPLSPQIGTFSIMPETWTRYWALFEKDASGYDLYSLWVADENNNAVQLFNRLQVRLVQNRFGIFRLEYNTSGTRSNPGSPLVSYVRNVVMLTGVPSVTPFLQRPTR